MKKFILKMFVFCIFLVAGLFILHHSANLILEDNCLSPEIESKIASLKLRENDINIIITGDSRAERQLIPRFFLNKTGYHTINVAVPSLDLVTLLYAIKKHYKDSRNIFIVSVSSWQINDGAIDIGYLSDKCFQKMSLLERLHIFSKNLQDLNAMHKRLAKYFFAYFFKSDILLPKIDDEIISENGFNGKTGNIDFKTDDIEISKYLINHPWYKRLSNNGIRSKIFEQAFRELGKIDSHFIIYTPPASPYWKKIIKNTSIEKSELYFAQKLEKMALEFNNIDFYDFYTTEIPELNDSMYYDPQHLNKDGASLFSSYLANLLNARIQNLIR